MNRNVKENKKPTLRITIPTSPYITEHRSIRRCQTPRYTFPKEYIETWVCRRLMDWEIMDYQISNKLIGHYIVGILPSGKIWETSDIKRLEINSVKLKAVTLTGSKYELYLTDMHKGNSQHIFL